MAYPPSQPLDLFSPQFKANPFPIYAWMRENAPVYGHVAPYGTRIWYVTRYEDVVAVLKDNERFTKEPPTMRKDESDPSNVFRMINRNMLFADPPHHSRLRHLVNQAFTPRRVEELAPRIREIAAGLIDRVYDKGHMDLIADFAFPLPVQVIMELLGIPAADQEKVHDWTKVIIAPGRHGVTLKARKRKVIAFVDYLHQMFAFRRQNPQDDLITALVQVEEAGDRLSEAELSSMIALLFVTGHETVVNLIGNGLLALLRHPTQLERLRQEPTLMETAVEELLRFDGPVETSTTRWASQDLTLDGREIKAGDVIRVVLTSANRDPGLCERPDDLDITRSKPAHLAFGLGIHYCLGAPLARLEGQIAFETLLNRLPGLRLANDPDALEWHTGVIFRGLKQLPLDWNS